MKLNPRYLVLPGYSDTHFKENDIITLDEIKWDQPAFKVDLPDGAAWFQQQFFEDRPQYFRRIENG